MSTSDATNQRPVALDLFAGAGGMSLGLEQAGFDVLAAVEYDPVHASVHHFNFPRTLTMCRDIATVEAGAVIEAMALGAAQLNRPWDESIDLIAGGPPCQGFSFIGKRLVDDERNQLVFHFFRLVSVLRPRYFVMENVPGMASGGHASILRHLVDEFTDAGYRFTEPYRILNAADFGVPQDRRRVFVLGARHDQALLHHPEPIYRPLAKRPGSPRPIADLTLPDGPSVWDAVGDLPDISRYAGLLSQSTIRMSARTLAEMESSASPYASLLRRLDHDPSDLSYPRLWDPSLLTDSARTNHTAASIARFRSTSPGITEPISRFYRLHPHGLCNTLRAGSGSERGAFTSPRPLHPTVPRVLSNREAARLHSFPDWFRFHSTKWHGFRQIGNAVAPYVARAVGQSVASALGLAPATRHLEEPAPASAPSLLDATMTEATLYFDADKAQTPGRRTRGASSIGARRLVSPAGETAA